MNARIATIVAILSCLAVSYVDAQCLLAEGDANTLNYALTLEHLEAAFYNGLNDAANTGISQAQFNIVFPNSVYPYIKLIQDHENSHVSLLTSFLSSQGCTPVPPCNYTFSSANAYASPTTFVTTAFALETTGVSAYDGAFNTITDPAIRQIAATIATVEGRHASYLALLNNFTPFPFTFDIANSSQQIYTVAGAFVNFTSFNCPLPQTSVVTLNYVNTSNFGFQAPGPVNGQCGLFSGDVSTLNYALALEHLEANFYNQALNNTNITTALNTPNITGLFSLPATIGAYIGYIRDHENAHVNFITSTFYAYGCNTTGVNAPVPACGQYIFGEAVNNVSTMIATGIALEDTGVSAYDGAANTIRDAGIRQAAATIATVEARHAAFLRVLGQQIPYPNVTDIPLQASAVIPIAATFINLASCPVTPSGPAFANGGINFYNASFQVQPNTTAAVGGTSGSVGTTQSATTATTTQSATTATTTQSATTVSATTVASATTTRSATTGTRPSPPPSATTGAASSVVASLFAVVALVAAVVAL